ncbi:hypothetical protein [Umezawaea sp.]
MGALTLVVAVRTVIFCWGAVIVLSALACQVVLRRADQQRPQFARGEA